MELDVNSGHVGFEFYRTQNAKLAPPKGAENLHGDKKFSIIMPVPGRPDLTVYGRQMVRGMGTMNFPRYIRREARNFMYLALRDILPGPNLAPLEPTASPGEGVWKTQGLPQGTDPFPATMATTFLRVEGQDINLLKIDPKRVDLTLLVSAKEERRIALGQGQIAETTPAEVEQEPDFSQALAAIGLGLLPLHSQSGLTQSDREYIPLQSGVNTLAIYKPNGDAPARLAIGKWQKELQPSDDLLGLVQERPNQTSELSANKPASAPARASAIGIDPSGFIVYAFSHSRERRIVAKALTQAGCAKIFYLDSSHDGGALEFVIPGQGGGKATISHLPGDAGARGQGHTRLVFWPHTRSAAVRVFEKVKPQPPSVWFSAQSKRKRYIPCYYKKDGSGIDPVLYKKCHEAGIQKMLARREAARLKALGLTPGSPGTGTGTPSSPSSSGRGGSRTAPTVSPASASPVEDRPTQKKKTPPQ